MAALLRAAAAFVLLASFASPALAERAAVSEARDRDLVAGLHTAYQAAARRNDAQTLRRILHERFVLLLGDGRKYSRAELIAATADGRLSFERHEDERGTRTLRIFGDTAVVTARLWMKGTKEGVAFERRVWFSDTYVRTPEGWRCAFSHVSPQRDPIAPGGGGQED